MSQGSDGIDIYIHNIFFEFNTNFNSTQLTIDQPVDIRDIYITNDNVLYVLCYNTGLHLYKLDTNNLTDTNNGTVKIIQKLISIPDAKNGYKLRIKEKEHLVFVIGNE